MSVKTIVAAVALGLSCPTFSIASEKATTSQAVSLPGTFSSPTGLAYDADGGLYVTEWSANRVTHVDRAGKRRLVTSDVRAPSGVVVGPGGTVYVSSYADGVVYRLQADARPEVFVRDLRTPAGLSIGRDGTLLIADRGLNQILRADASGKARMLVKGLPTPVGVVEFPDGALVVSNFAGGVIEVNTAGVQRELSGRLGSPAVGIVADGPDAVLVPDYSGTSVWRITRNGSASELVRELRSPVAMARAADGSEIAIGNWGDSSVRRYGLGSAR